MIPVLWACVAATAVGFGSGWVAQGWRWGAADAERLEQAAKDLHRATERAQASSGAFETKRATNEIKYRTVTRTVTEYIDRPVYLQQCLDDDGLRVLNEQITGRADTGKSGASVPRP